MAALLSAVSADTTGAGVSITGPATVYVRGLLRGANVAIELAPTNTPADYVEMRRFFDPTVCFIEIAGAAFIRARVAGVKTAGASITVDVIQ
jgi:hypothetical protein